MKIRAQTSSQNTSSGSAAYNALFRPRSIVVVGGSESTSKPGGKVLKNIISHGYEGDLWVVNPTAVSVSGLPTFKEVSDLPGTPELAIVAIPARLVADSLRSLAEKDCGAVIILTAGFGEKDRKGKEEELRLASIAESAGMTLVGPNCSGFVTPCYSGKFAGITPRLKPRAVDFFSGSGATVDLVFEQALPRGMNFCNVLNVGNSAQIAVEDLLALHDENYHDESGRILMLYLESLRRPELLLKHARSLTKKGCAIVGIKSGVSTGGARAAASHTGAMAADDTAVDALFRKAGIIRVASKMEMIDVAGALAGTGGNLRGNRVCVITDAGGPGVMLTDALEKEGLVVPVLKEETRLRLQRVLPPEASVANPIDCLPTRTPEQIEAIFAIVQETEKESIDAIAVHIANPGMSHNRAMYEVMSRAMDSSVMPIIPILSSVASCTKLIREFTGGGKFFFWDEVSAGAALGKVLNRPVLREADTETAGYDREGIGKILKGRRGALTAAEVAGVLGKAGFRLPRQAEITSPDELDEACDSVGYPLAMKVSGPLHKSDLNGVRLGIASKQEAKSVWRELAAIPGATGVTVQQMVEGIETIVGSVRKGGLGHLCMVGMGGIYTEVLKDVTFALAPLSGEECVEMIKGLKTYLILKGIRGQRGVSIDGLADYIGRIARLVSDFPSVSEIDLNPVKGYESDLLVVDARIILD